MSEFLDHLAEVAASVHEAPVDDVSEIVLPEHWMCTGCRRTFSPDDPCFEPGVCVDCSH
jgi:hypothetical protein